MSGAVISPAPKVDPETLEIRTNPPRAIRFRRDVIIAIAALGSVSLMTVAWIALRPRVFSAITDRQELSEPRNRPSTDTLNGLPATYGDIPKLGPLLPGDLGRPILESQRRMAAETGTRSDPSAQQAAQERERRLSELKAARESAVLVQGRTAATTTAMPEMATTLPSAAAEVSGSTLYPGRDSNAKAKAADALDRRGDVNPHTLTPAPSPYLLSAGSIISASLITGLRSDLPGLVTAQVISQVFDSPTGRILLIPQGARLIGSYDNVVAFGQKRALIVWQRIMMPDGSSLRIDNVPATDASGYAGLQDKVDFHTWALLKGVALSTVLGVGSQLTATGESDLVEAIRESTQQNVSRAGDQLTSLNLNIQPTLTIRPGTIVLLVVQKDLILAPWRG
ncbi:TrbI/VirB10 family protein [Hephaestia sp. GCM10023244]|uniref:TrbI/VirB10 family protein n=1 Tax=unclassified Hephaestia TaxID=2631281 RepID=UPI0020771249|nr:TrbI/VirB10 family protein [Hephaestia sp. MAHUQ-44]MCM8731811.1 conjugal transfer protein TrbI [Hephaestia sp. MAHUQ-44]